MIGEDGVFYLYHIEKVCDFLIDRLRVPADDIELIDSREDLIDFSSVSPITEDFLAEYNGGLDLRDYQMDSVNFVIENKRGILHLATNAGKSWICVALSKALDPLIKSIVIVPSQQLAKQTFKDYQMVYDMSSCIIESNDSAKKRQEKIENHRHIIITTQLFCNIYEMLIDDTYALIYDEAHRFGEVTENIIRYGVPHWPIRVGMTGSLPTDKFKLERLICCMGGDVMKRLKPHELVERGLASRPTITMHTIRDEEFNDVADAMKELGTYDWSVEQNYTYKNPDRVRRITDFIIDRHSADPINTLVLCQAAVGNQIAELMETSFIDKDTDTATRQEMFQKFREVDDHLQLASFGTSSTGISENNILRLYMIDVGKDETTILQSIGRGMRLDGVVNEVEVIDISSDTPFAMNHRRERKKLYKRERFDYNEADEKLEVI